MTLPRPSVAVIARAAAALFGVDLRVLTGDSRAADVVRMRHAVCYVCVRVYGHSQSYTGAVLGRDHTTVRAAVLSIAARLPHDGRLEAEVAALARRAAQGPVDADPSSLLLPRRERAAVAVPPTPPCATAADSASEFKRLRAKGWSVKGLAKRFGVAEPAMAQLVGAQWGSAAR